MIQLVILLTTTVVLHASAHAADKVRISMTGFAGQFMTFPQKDPKYLAVGPPDARYAARSQGFGPPLDFEAKKQDFNILTRANDIAINASF
jgi:hypothetical protein